MLALTEYIPEHDIYMVIPVYDGKPDPDNEYVFANEDDQMEFLQYYMLNPIAAGFAYEARLNSQAAHFQDKTFYDMVGYDESRI